MPIAPLPAGAVRTLGSAQALTTPTSLVKELIDNALDAQASAIFIEVSPNTIDTLQVKDNGHGIAPGPDRDKVGKRHCTSKIRNLKELKALGGDMLGFRGEALASAIELAANVAVITRTEGEVVGCKIVMNRLGQVESKEPTSHPVGTTIRVSGFIKHLPVRREATLKSSSKTLLKIKELVQTYTLARPKVRFSLKIPRAKNEKGDWSYAPSSNASMADAAMKVVGNDAVGQCSLLLHSAGLGQDNSSDEGGKDVGSVQAPSKNEFAVEAFLPRSDADYSKINDKGHFIFIDSRPVSCSRNTLKQILTSYKSYLRSSLTNVNSLAVGTKIKDPFICMNIRCPRGSYDPNVEPSKDDIIFENADKLLSVVDSFFCKIYGEKKEADYVPDIPKSKPAGKAIGFELLLARKKETANDLTKEQDGDVAQPSEGPVGILAPQNPRRQEPRTDAVRVEAGPIFGIGGLHTSTSLQSEGKNLWRRNMYEGFDDESDDATYSPIRRKSLSDEHATRDEKGRTLSNPWVIAKLNTSTRLGGNGLSDHEVEATTPNLQLATPSMKRSSLPQGIKVHDLIYSISTDLESVERSLQQMRSIDEYVQGQEGVSKPVLQTNDALELAKSVTELIRATYLGENEETANVPLDFLARRKG